MTIAVRSFRSEALIVAICYLWHLLSQLGFHLDRLVLRRKQFNLQMAGRSMAECELLTSFLYGRDVCWVRLTRSEGIDPAVLIETLREMVGAFRLAIFRLEDPDPLPVHWPELQPHGAFAGFAIYSLRRTNDSKADTPFALETGAKEANGKLLAQFYLVKKGGKPIGVTGTYSVDFWPGIVWGGWGALIRPAGYRDAGLETVSITERLARLQEAGMFCIETSDGRRYRAARRIYEIYGLELLLEIPDFYHDGEAFLVFGKALVNDRRPARV